jgi:hypothetical protein
MSTLRLEELESRSLLNGTGFLPQRSWFGGTHFGPGPGSEPPSFLGGYSAPAPFDRGLMGDPFADRGGLSWGGAPQWLDAGGPSLYALAPTVEVIVITIRLPDQVAAPDVRPDVPPPAVTAADPKPAPIDPHLPPSQPDAGRGATPASQPRTATQTPFVLTIPTNVPAGAPAIVAAQLPAQPGGGGAAPVLGPGPVAQPTPAAPAGVAVPPVTVPTAEPAADGPAPGALPGVLAAFPAADLTALGRGLQQFLDRLESAGRDLVGDGDGAGLRPWVVAAGTAAAACEIARRQWKQRSEVRGQKSGGLLTSDL